MVFIQKATEKVKKYFSKESKELRRLLKIPRYERCNTFLLGGIELADSVSFVAGYEEIFIRENYKFFTNKEDPFIIDCGSNIGLSLIYFKKLFPDAQIICFEPDPTIFSILKNNARKLGFKNISILNKALSNQKGVFSFASEGGFSGRIADNSHENGNVKVEVDILSQYIDREVDFLKIDIEGHELLVLEEIEHKLPLIKKMFLEYHSIYKKEQTLEKILSILKHSGFRIHIKEAGSAPHPFIEVPVTMGMDNQLEIYAWK